MKFTDSEECSPYIVHRRQRRPNPIVTSPEEYWRVTITIPLLDSIISEHDKRVYYELCSSMPEMMLKNDDLETLISITSNIYCDLLPSSDSFNTELHRSWKLHCAGIPHDKSITNLLSQDADLFFPNIRELCVFWLYYQVVD